MIKKFLSILSAIVLSSAVLTAIPQDKNGFIAMKASAAETVVNPVIWSDVPDCDVIRVGDTYYMISTTMFFSPGAPIMKSKDLVSWEICSYVYDTLADGDVQNLTNGKHDYAHGQWAASLRYHDGNFYVFFGSYGTGKSYIYKTDDIEHGKWTRSEINGMYHDASILFDDDGRNYLVYGGGGEIKIKEFNAEMTDFKWGGVDKTLFKTGLDGLAGEGSHIQKIGDYYYVFVIAWPSGSGRIELCYRSKELTGTYEGKTVLNSGLGTYGSGVAQGGIVDTPDGKWYGMLFQDHGSVGRIPVLVPVTWVDGYPIMGVNGKAPVTFEVENGYTGTQLAKDDSFSYSLDKLALEWQWNHNPDNMAWSVTEREGWLRLKNKTLATNILNAKNTLTQRTEGPACSSVIKLDTSGMNIGDYAGLSAFQFKYGNVGVYIADDGSHKVYMSENGGYSGNSAVTDSYDKIIEEVPLNEKEVYLKAEFTFNTVDENMNVSNNIDKVKFFYSLDGNSWTRIGNELNMSYDLKLFTGYRSGIYSYGTKNLNGYADIDFFDYERSSWNEATSYSPNDFGWWYNCTFSDGTQGWTDRGGNKVEQNDNECYTTWDKSSLHVYDRTSAWQGTAYNLKPAIFKSGESYSFSAHVKQNSGENVKFMMKIEYKDSDGETAYDEIASVIAPDGTWAQLANSSYTIPDGASNVHIYIETEDSLTDFYVDECIGAVDGTGIAGEGQPDIKEIILGDTNSDGRIDVFDMINATKCFTGEIQDADMIKSSDIDKNGNIEINDLVMLQKYILGIIKYFPLD
ncbi:MAG: family 43 glycosylhydrolase [Ruminococcus sp.]|nr:family 43 glycosylhydrolase [Ruminococcus sp.]